MNKEESLMICTMLEANYQPFKDLTVATNLWADAFADVPFDLVRTAVTSYMMHSTDDYRPNVGKIAKEIDTILNGEQMSDMEAWELVRKAVSKSKQTDSSAYREWKKLPEDIQQIVSSEQILRWQMLNVEQMDTVVQSNFAKSYQTVKERKYKTRVLPENLKNAVALLQSSNPDYMALPEATKPEVHKYEESFDDMYDRLDENARQYREKHGMTANPEYADRAIAFANPTQDELKKIEEREKQKFEAKVKEWKQEQ